MNTSSHFDAPHIVVLKEDPSYGNLLRQLILHHWPRARVAVFHRGRDALASLRQATPDLFLTGIKLDDMDGLEHMEPFVESDLPILVITSRADPHTFRLLRRVRYDGLFDALGDRFERLPEAIHDSLRRTRYVSPSFAQRLKSPSDGAIDSLTDAEQLVLAVIGDGTNNKKAAQRLGLSSATVKTHRKFIMRKLGIHDKALLTRYVVQQGFIVLKSDAVRRPGFERRLASIANHVTGGNGSTGERFKSKKGPPRRKPSGSANARNRTLVAGKRR